VRQCRTRADRLCRTVFWLPGTVWPGRDWPKAVCKATTEEIIGPKKKHLDYLLQCTNEPNVSIPTLANLLLERTLNPSWVVVYKSLITIHHLMCYGNERFTQYLASSNSNFQLANFLDKTGVQGYDMSPFIRRYAKYLGEKSTAYRGTAMDFCKVKRGKDGGALRIMSGDKLLKTLPLLQNQVDALLEFDCTSTDLNNGVINACFMLLFRDLIRLFACYNDGIINLLEKYFEMQKKQARDALDLYKKFLIRMDRVAEFLKVAESVGIDKGDIPDLAKAPSSLLEALEGHLASLEGRKPGSGGTTPTQGGHRVNVAAAVNVLNTTSNAFGTAAASNGGGNIDEKTAKQLMEEEAAAMEKFRSGASASNPFAAAPAGEKAEETPNILDLFGVASPAPAAGSVSQPPPAQAQQSTAASDDLLQLTGNPFANMLNAAAPQTSSPAMFQSSPAPGFAAVSSQSFSSPFVSDNNFDNVFGQNNFGVSNTITPTTDSKLVTGDLDSSLANLASNLNFGPAANRNFVSGPARGPPMAATNPAGFNPFPQQQQQMEMLSSPATPSFVSSQTLPNLTSSPVFPAPANHSSSPFMGRGGSNNTLFPSPSQTQFADLGPFNGTSAGQFLNNNAVLPSKPLSSLGLEQTGLL